MARTIRHGGARDGARYERRQLAHKTIREKAAHWDRVHHEQHGNRRERNRVRRAADRAAVRDGLTE